ncbi:ribitol-5-phosphate dehydrogenase [Exiguobacterium sp. s192]|uniref:ribitol-5-phosphate dehydrogenase n=1 Tax=Exiguobacterium sp. s192 TaxID=2751206 RepID=UPI001BE940C9|nr:ribitol-5-phosphate dehydrogenase [Exiguobacterium sp. s192]
MINQVYQLVAPRQIEVTYDERSLNSDRVVVRPTYLSICHADQRYFTGSRSAEVLAKKLPMAMIHEGIGKVVHDPSGTFPIGTLVAMVPNTPSETDAIIGENYLRTSRFRSSGYDGYMQDYVFIKPDRLVVVPADLDPEVAAFTELVSVSVHAMTRFDQIAHSRRETFGVWGDGNLGFITALMLRKLYPEAKLLVFGKTQSKLDYFSFADETYHIDQIPESVSFNHGFECVGGIGSQYAINQMIDYIIPEGTMALLGVSEEPVAVNTRMILEKGLRVYGSSRSTPADFARTMELYQLYPDIPAYLSNLVSGVFQIRQIEDIHQAFESDLTNRFGKTVMEWCM